MVVRAKDKHSRTLAPERYRFPLVGHLFTKIRKGSLSHS